MMDQYNHMLPEQPGVTSGMGEYTVTYYAMRDDNDSIGELKEEFAIYEAHHIKTDSIVSAMSEHNKSINQCLTETQAALQVIMMRPQSYQQDTEYFTPQNHVFQ